MQNHTFIPMALVLIVGLAFYFIYGYLSPASVNLAQYQSLCETYRTAEAGRYSTEEQQMLINEVGFLIPDEIKDIRTPSERALKQCVTELAKRLDSGK